MSTSRAEIMDNLGPLRQLAGIWEGSKGKDVAPSDDRGTENNSYKERITFEPFGPVNNHEQTLWGLRYTTTAWRLNESDAYHEESGYWLWDPKDKQVMRMFMIPRGVTVLAGATVEANANSFQLKAECGSTTYGICSNLFLDKEFKTVRYTLNINVSGQELSYDEDTELAMKGRKEIFHHTDKNTLKKVSEL